MVRAGDRLRQRPLGRARRDLDVAGPVRRRPGPSATLVARNRPPRTSRTPQRDLALPKSKSRHAVGADRRCSCGGTASRRRRDRRAVARRGVVVGTILVGHRRDCVHDGIGERTRIHVTSPALIELPTSVARPQPPPLCAARSAGIHVGLVVPQQRPSLFEAIRREACRQELSIWAAADRPPPTASPPAGQRRSAAPNRRITSASPVSPTPAGGACSVTAAPTTLSRRETKSISRCGGTPSGSG